MSKQHIGGFVRRDSLIFAAFLLAAAPAYADNDTVQRAPVPDWVAPSELMPVPADAGGLVFVRRNDTLIHLDQQGQAIYLAYRVKILHPTALQLGNINVAWDPSAGAPTVHNVRIYRDGTAIDVLANARFEILRREDQLEAASLNGILTAVLRVPDLRVGDELEVGFTIRSRDPALGGNDSGLLFLAASPPQGRFRLGLSWVDGREPHLGMTPDMAAVAQRSARAVTLNFDNPPIVSPPGDAPPRFRLQRMVEYSDFADWPAVSRLFTSLFATAARLDTDSPLREEARRIAAAHPGMLERAGAALRLVQEQVRYVFVGLGNGKLTPATADLTWQRRYGDCKGKTALLLALLSELGIEAEPVLASNAGADDGLDARLPSPRMFDHVLVRARIGGSVYWLDGTLPAVAEPSLTPVLPYRWVLPLQSRGSALESVPWHAPETPDEVTLEEIDARAGFDRPARITFTTIVRGLDGLRQQAQFSGVTPDQLLTSLRQNLVGATWQTIDQARWRYDLRARASVLTISGTGTVDWEGSADGERALILPGGGFNPPDRRARSGEQDQNAPYYTEPKFTCFVTSVRLPDSTQPSNWSFNSSFDTNMFGRTFYRAFELRDGSIRMIRGSRVEQREIDAETARRDNARIAAFDNSMARISYDRLGAGSRAGTGQRVPAPDEIDWTAGNVPCLSSSARAGQ
jgi:hypothetical protein